MHKRQGASNSKIKKIQEKISNIDIVYIGGGEPENFNKDKDFKKYLKEIIRYKKGIMLSGLSAGCAIWFTEIAYIKNNKIKILKGLNSMGISVIDLGEFFDNISSVNSYFSLGYFGHFNANGYNKIAEIISNKLE